MKFTFVLIGVLLAITACDRTPTATNKKAEKEQKVRISNTLKKTGSVLPEKGNTDTGIVVISSIKSQNKVVENSLNTKQLNLEYKEISDKQKKEHKPVIQKNYDNIKKDIQQSPHKINSPSKSSI